MKDKNKNKLYKAMIGITIAILLLSLIFHALLPILLNEREELKGTPNVNDTTSIVNQTPTKNENSTIPNPLWNFVKESFDFVNRNGGIFSIITFILGAIIGVFRNKIRAFIYNLFWLRGIIKKYKSHINKNYNSIKLSLPGCDIKELAMETAYIKLSIGPPIDNNAKKQDQKEEVQMQEEKKQTQGKSRSSMDVIKDPQYQYLLITGSPGSGKSTLCKNVVYQYGINALTDKIPIFIELGYDIKYPNDMEKSIIEIIEKRLDISESDLLIKKKLSEGVFRIIFDAFDEVATDIETINKRIVEFIKQYNKCSYIITCRKSVSDNFKKKDLAKDIKTFEINDLKIEDIENYAKVWKREDPKLNVNFFVDHLAERSKIRELTKEPFMVASAIYLFQRDGSLPYSRTMFFEKLTDYLIDKNDRKTNTQCIDYLSRIAWEIQPMCDSTDDKDSHIISLKNVEKIIGANCDEVLCTLEKSGILQKIQPKSNLNAPTHYRFSLKPYREYYVARYVKHFLKECNNEDERRKVLLDKHKDHPFNYREIVKFYCGMCGENDNVSKLLEELYNYDLERESTVALEALSESLNVNGIANTILDYYFHINIDTWQKGDWDISKALGAIVANISEKDNEYKSRGKEVFGKLEKSFKGIYPDRMEHPLSYKNIVSALASSFTTEASELLLKHYQKDDDVIYNALTKIGNVCVSRLGEFAEKGDTNAADCLVKIGTDKALKELIRIIFLKKESESITSIAWHLSQTKYIKQLKSIGNNILDDDYNITMSNLKKEEHKKIDFLWSPFGTMEEPLTHIMNRIGYLLDNTSTNTDIHDVIVDDHLLIPLRIKNTNKNFGQNEVAKTGYTKYINNTKHEQVKDSIKEIDNILKNPSYDEMKDEDWQDDWANINNNVKKETYHFDGSWCQLWLLLLINILIFGNLLTLALNLSANNNNHYLTLAFFVIFIIFSFTAIVKALCIDQERYSNNELMNWFGLMSKTEAIILIFYLIAGLYLFELSLKTMSMPSVPLVYTVFYIVTNVLVIPAALVFVWVRYKRWSLQSMLSELVDKLNLNFSITTVNEDDYKK